MSFQDFHREAFSAYMSDRPLIPGGLNIAMEVAAGQRYDVTIAVGDNYLGVRADIYVHPGLHPNRYSWPVCGQYVTVVVCGKISKKWMRTLMASLLHADCVWLCWDKRNYVFRQQDLIKFMEALR